MSIPPRAPVVIRDSESAEGVYAADMIDAHGILRFLRRRWPLIVLAQLAALLAGFSYYVQATPQYRAVSEVLFEPRAPRVIDASVYGSQMLDDRTIDTQVEVLGSKALARDAAARPALRKIFDIPAKGDPGEAFALDAAAAEISANLTVRRRGVTSIVVASYDADSPISAAAVLNTLVSAYLTRQQTAKADETANASRWLDERLKTLRAEVVEAERNVEAYRVKSGLRDTGDMSLDDRRLIDLTSALAKARAERQLKEAQVNQFKAQGIPLSQDAPALIALRQRQDEIAQRLAQITERYGPQHPTVIAAQKEADAVARQIADETARIRKAMQDDLNVARGTERGLQAEIDKLQGDVDEREQGLVKLHDLERQAEASRDVYQTFLARSKQISDQQNLARPDASVLQSASPPRNPYSPNLRNIILIAGFAGTFVGVGFGLLREFGYGGFNSYTDLERKTGLRHLATVPRLGRRGRKRSIRSVANAVVSRPAGPYAESINRLALMISSAAESGEILSSNVLVFTSAIPDEGKSSMALSFARSCALSGERVVLIDADLRRPSIAKYLGGQPVYGLEEYLKGAVGFEQVLCADRKTDLVYVPASCSSENPRELFGSERWADLVKRLPQAFDRVVIDSPPLLAFPEAITLSKAASAAVLVVKWRTTDVSAVREAVEQMRAAHASIAGAVLSQADMPSSRRYGYYDYPTPPRAQARRNVRLIASHRPTHE